LFNERIEITNQELKDFFDDLWPEEHDPNLLHPDVEYLSADHEEIIFEWDQLPAPSSNHFRIKSLSLTTGETTELYTPEFNVKLTLPNDFYLFSFQSMGGGGFTSDAYIIIIEKPVKYGAMGSCNCLNYDQIWDSALDEINENTSASYFWDTENEQDYFFCRVEYDSPNLNTASFIMDVRFDGGIPIEIQTPSNCWENVAIGPEDGNAYLEILPIENALAAATLSFNHVPGETEPGFTYNASEDFEGVPTGHVYLYRCGKKKRQSDSNSITNSLKNEEIGLKELSHSFSSLKEIEFKLKSNKKVSLAIYNSYGQLVEQVINQENTTAGSHRTHIDFQNYPNGSYFCILKTDDQIKQLKLVKIY